MLRGLRWAAVAAFLSIQGGAISAQYYYPPGYASAGWGGWGGGGGGGSTVYGDQARGMGVFATGAGIYNEKTAVARSINANTAMQWNEYIWQSQQATNRRYHEKMARDRAEVNLTADSLQKRLRDNPTESDIMKGDALNVALDEVSNPKVYTKALQGAKAKFSGAVIREIPFQYASAALTTSIDDLTQNGPPDLLKAPEFKADLEALRAVRAKFRAQDEHQQDVDPALVAEAKRLIKSMNKTLADNATKFKKGSAAYRGAENYLKGLYGLVTMLDSPAINVVLAGVEKRPDTTVGDLLGFMQAFNLRFGVAKTPEQRMAYTQLYPILAGLRGEVEGVSLTPDAGKARQAPTQPAEFFSGMNYDHLDAKRVPPPPAARP